MAGIKMNDKISVVVPIYKVEKYLRRSIDSIITQSYQNLEIILVDDGSPDLSGNICESYAVVDSRVQVIHKQNGGLSSARNAGICAATGEYIAFVDSDDVIQRHYIERMYAVAKSESCDIVQCDFFRFTDEIPSEQLTQIQEIVSTENALKKINTPYYMAAWNKLYKSSLFKEIRFPEGKIHEDVGCTYKLFMEAKKIAVIPDKLYGYFENSNSITTSKIKLNKLDLVDIYAEQAAYFAEKGLYQNANSAANNLAACFGTLLSYELERYDNYTAFTEEIQKKFRAQRHKLLRYRLRPDLYLAILLSFGNVKFMKYYHCLKTGRFR